MLRKEMGGKVTDNEKIQYKSFIAHLDDFVFVKNGYSVWKHLVPFSIAALLLIILSIPTDDLLLKLADLLQEPRWLWLPAGLLTVISTAVYYYTINVQIRQAYLWKDGDRRRTIGTSLAYITLCTLMAYAVLPVSLGKTTFGDIWASFLLAILSLTGIGWSGPNSWVESIGIKSPDYTEGRLAAKELTNILNRVRIKDISNKQDVEDFSKAIENLRSNIKTNLELEPEWAKDKLEKASDALFTLSKQVEKNFPTNNKSVEYFAAACRCQMGEVYKEFIETFNILSEYWCEWQCKKA